MRQTLGIFLLAVLLPSGVLGWLALRSAEEQKIILERRTAELYQKEVDELATAARAIVDEQRRGFTEIVRKLVGKEDAERVASAFPNTLAHAWSRKAIGFAIGRDGRVLSPTPRAAADRAEWQRFLWEHGSFLGGRVAAQVYSVAVDELTQPEVMRKSRNASLGDAAAPQKSSSPALVLSKQMAPAEKAAVEKTEQLRLKMEFASPAADAASSPSPSPPPPAKPKSAAPPARAPASPPVPPAPSRNALAESDAQFPPTPREELKSKDDADTGKKQTQLRNVAPQQVLVPQDRAAWSALAPETAEFSVLSAGRDEGMITRFVQDRLGIIFWLRPPQAPELIFGCLLDAADLADLWPAILPHPSAAQRDGAEFVLALLDDKGRPVVASASVHSARDWKRPFVAAEIGEALPHWETALYLARPEQLQKSARGVRRTLTFLIFGMVGAIALGGWLVVADARRQLARAQQKTDFVSNVSHELKTPLTSIRMFAELMLAGRAETQAKAPQYLRIIMVEAERLTRLINNVLDFAKLERKQKRFDKKLLDLHAVLARTWESHELHLRESGFTTAWEAAPPPYAVIGDEDALAQILVNLLSNAEKYSGEHREVTLHSYLDGDHVCVSVLDRGVGVPENEERKIFEAFYRAQDSLSSGIQGSGLGLTLAHRLAREHRGEILYRARPGGGSSFTLRLPLAQTS